MDSTMGAISYRVVLGKYYFCYQLQGSACKVLWLLSSTGWCVESTIAAQQQGGAWKVLWLLSATGWCMESTMGAISYRVVRGNYCGYTLSIQGGA